MEERKKFGSSAIMLVGVVFIIVSGIIFVSTGWNYIPDVVKKIALAVFTGLLYVGAHQVQHRWGLKKAAGTLYYLGTVFTGITVYAFAGYLDQSISARLMLAQAAMSVPLICRAIFFKSAPDMVFQLVLTDTMVLNLAYMLEKDSLQLLLYSASVITLLLAVIIERMYRDLPEERDGLGLVKVVFALHMVYTFAFSLMINLTDDAGLLLRIIPSAMILVAITKLYKIGENDVLGKIQNICVLHFNFAVAYGLSTKLEMFLNDNQFDDLCRDICVFLMFALTVAWAFILKRGGLLKVVQSVLLAAVIFSDFSYTWNSTRIPYSYYGILMVPVLYFWNEELDLELSGAALRRTMGLWVGMFLGFLLHAVFSVTAMEGTSFYANLDGYFIEFQLAMAALIMAEMAEGKEDTAAVLRTAALSFVLFAFWEAPLISTLIRGADGSVLVDLQNEYAVILATVFVVLLEKIWYHKVSGEGNFRYKYTCLALGFLLLTNLGEGNAINAILLTFAALVLLIVASKIGSKRYVIAAAVTLSLMAIYMTRVIWMSIAWWVYLFLAGVGLVIYAVKREKDAL